MFGKRLKTVKKSETDFDSEKYYLEAIFAKKVDPEERPYLRFNWVHEFYSNEDKYIKTLKEQ